MLMILQQADDMGLGKTLTLLSLIIKHQVRNTFFVNNLLNNASISLILVKINFDYHLLQTQCFSYFKFGAFLRFRKS